MNASHATNGAPSSSRSPPLDMSQPPPELPKLEECYLPFGRLVGRVAQETNNTLGDLLVKMSNLQISPAQALTNGVNGHLPNGDATPPATSDARKRMLLDWAWEEREKFVKLLVLSKWGRRADDVTRLIELNMWLSEQERSYDDAATWIGHLKLNMQRAMDPSPDLKTALEVLSTGKVAAMPDLGYVPSEPPSPQQMLKTVANVNALLSIRINLHEELPRQLQDWTIAHGRATFVVPSEFELDVSIADEDPSTPFFIVDVRFLFSPKPDVSDDLFREYIEPEANRVLASSGLAGCYNWLHGFVLTHKITTLKAQADELAATAWAGALYVKQIHRSLIVQYWIDTLGAKSWIEIGVSSGRPKDGKVSWRGPNPPEISLKWVRRGTPVEHIPIKVDWSDLSLESILKAIVALHINFIFDSTRDQLYDLVPAASGLSVSLETSDQEPTDCCLAVKPGNLSRSTVVRIDPLSGRLSFQPSTARSTQAEHEINSKDLLTDVASRTETLICTDLKLRIDKQAENAGWVRIRNVNIKRETTAENVGQRVVAQSFYRGNGWKSNWVIGLTINLTGESWWLFELDDNKVASKIHSSMSILGLHNRQKRPVSQDFLQALERLTVSEATYAVAMKELSRINVHYALRSEKRCQPQLPERPSNAPVLFLEVGPLAGDRGTDGAWAHSILKFSHCGFERKSRRIILLIEGRMAQRQPDVELASAQGDDVSFNSDGTFTISLKTELGQPFMNSVMSRLKRIERVGSYMDVIKTHNLRFEHLGLSRMVVRYGGKFKVDIHFPEGEPTQLVLDSKNPHMRILGSLRRALNDPNTGFSYFMRNLLLTLPVMQAFDVIQSSAPSYPHPIVHNRDLLWYRISYENPSTNFDLRLRPRNDVLEWYLHDPLSSTPSNHNNANNNQQQQPVRAPEYAAAIKEMLRQRGPRWRGIRSGIIAESDGIKDAIIKLDEVVKRFQQRPPPGGQPPQPQPQPQAQPKPRQQQQPPSNQHHQQQHPPQGQQHHPGPHHQPQLHQRPPGPGMQPHHVGPHGQHQGQRPPPPGGMAPRAPQAPMQSMGSMQQRPPPQQQQQQQQSGGGPGPGKGHEVIMLDD
ncbi:mediator complex subunit MED14-domain-containing protein [Phyllosticta citrichinensis]|uniref:Mediator of RNA polymerase II transcription subunit 14 n=1 Tax=Phyllosticta citrichinensis TaxID=1130410 RepID=A0ABR1Y287_9PEZI